jgi:hypothetical protein
MAQIKLNKKDILFIEKNIKAINVSQNNLRKFEHVLFDRKIFVVTKHGNFGGESRLISIGAKIAFDVKDLSSGTINANKILRTRPRVYVGYSCHEGTSYLIFNSDKIKLNREKQCINFDHIVSESPGFPSYIGIKDKEDFRRVVGVLRDCYRAAGFRQKGILI